MVGWWEVRKLIKMAEFLNSEVGKRKENGGQMTGGTEARKLGC
jgi:hypothetical protein